MDFVEHKILRPYTASQGQYTAAICAVGVNTVWLATLDPRKGTTTFMTKVSLTESTCQVLQGFQIQGKVCKACYCLKFDSLCALFADGKICWILNDGVQVLIANNAMIETQPALFSTGELYYAQQENGQQKIKHISTQDPRPNHPHTSNTLPEVVHSSGKNEIVGIILCENLMKIAFLDTQNITIFDIKSPTQLEPLCSIVFTGEHAIFVQENLFLLNTEEISICCLKNFKANKKLVSFDSIPSTGNVRCLQKWGGTLWAIEDTKISLYAEDFENDYSVH